ncbi:MAG TPA: NAD(P)H-hydrate dehydratase [Aquabacterium sp.]|uniref:NAD(P)H-hydrate dehydratase n=1 Tax=Aquabacterium sp. TaxID=1872578 RepID=UPI002E2FE47D|nr:NAD(P)H-hydrate dehydratase [Aquabacterium sp.]HEX5371489.1 NAD(P)H-hydrate dehydratase [Aquabacterium sp.]
MSDLTSSCLLSCRQMGLADAWTMTHGVPGIELMENAGAAVVRAIRQRWSPRPVTVLCGPGNNGGDGYVVARLLGQAGWLVTVASLQPIEQLRGDALHHARLWQAWCVESSGEASAGQPLPLGDAALMGTELVVDAIFGAGLDRPLEPTVHALLMRVPQMGVPLVAVDVPSGLQGDTGQNLGATHSTLTVTFFRKKPGHVLMPGRALCGELVVADIGIAEQAIDALSHDGGDPLVQENHPGLWASQLPPPALAAHKYQRGHALVLGGARMVGAARLTARGAARVGAGLVSLVVPRAAWPVYAATLLSAMAQPLEDGDAQTLIASWGQQLEALHWHALALGPGARQGLPGDASETLRALVRTALSEPLGRPMVLDADALTVFQEEPAQLFDTIGQGALSVVLTPHEGEFSRLFGTLAQGQGQDKVARTRAAAVTSGAVVLHKGADTVIAAPDGRVVINTNGPPWLATGGSGDVLTGFIAGLLAQGLEPMEAACAGAWLHGACAQVFGPGLLAEDLPEQLPRVLGTLWGR